MDLKSGMPFWLIRDGLMFNYPKLEEDLHTDVLVLGGGVSGALSAYYLSRAGINCTVADARSIGLGSTCASTSLLQYEIDVPLCELQHKIGFKNALRSYQLCAQSILKLQEVANDIGFEDFHLKKSLYYAAAKKNVSFLKEEYAIRKRNNFAVNFLDKEMVKCEFNFDAPAAILSELGAQTNAYAFSHALHQFNINNGCKVYDRTEIASIQHNRNNVKLITSNKKIITAKKLVYATGYESVKYLNKKVATLHSTYAIISENRNSGEDIWKDDVLIWNTDDPYLYLRTTGDRRIIIGGRDEKFYNPEKRDKLLVQKSKELVKDFKKLFPAIEFKTDYCWTGTFGSTKDGLPFIGPYKPLLNSYFTLGFGGNGITFSLIAAEIITDLILGKENADAKIFEFERS
ncbi:MAG: FAD-binding oxidoreductase [Bacteroidota bacterium]|nr:FAD-binding oxidoreductase [Bacteroidota bacterium]